MQRTFGPIKQNTSSIDADLPAGRQGFVRQEAELAKREGILEEREKQIWIRSRCRKGLLAKE